MTVEIKDMLCKLMTIYIYIDFSHYIKKINNDSFSKFY